jgi:outer membrane protein insertion porin family
MQVDNDSIDIEIRIREGKQARINKVTVKGNSKTNDHVVIREIKTIPGQLFSRSDIIRTTRELAQLRYFNAETIKPVPTPNPEDGTVDIEYQVEETSSDQVELSGGWGGGMVVGTLGLSFNNFSARNIFKKNAWRPLPAGDGQKLSLRGQTNGKYYYSVSASFTEPWLGGKKPNSLSVSIYHSKQTNGYDSESSDYASLTINGGSVGLGKRLRWPDDYFTIFHSLSLQNYVLNNYGSLFSFSDGYANNLNYSLTIARNSIDAPIYARSGSEISLTLQLTPPFSMFSSKDYTNLSDQDKFKWIEYHKWKFKASWFFNLTGKWVLNTKARFGFVGFYNSDIGYPPFERFYLGGDGLSGYALDGRELIALRGYGNNTLTPKTGTNYVGGNVYDKFTVELRYPLSLNPNATIYGLAFMEGGNAWKSFKEFNPYNMYKAAGFGVRIFLPMFGMLGLDWGYGFDKVPGFTDAAGGQFHFSINQSID